MKLPWLIRCSSRMEGDRCDLPRFHGPQHQHREDRRGHYWHTETTRRQTYETNAPWVTWTWLSNDRETRLTGRMRMKLTCCICGKREVIRPRIPRWGPVPEPPNGVHPERIAAIERHQHPTQRNPRDWALPFRNPFGTGGLDLGMMENVARTARMEADAGE